MKRTWYFVAAGLLALAADALHPRAPTPDATKKNGTCDAESGSTIALSCNPIALQPLEVDGAPVVDISAGLAGLTLMYRS